MGKIPHLDNFRIL